MFTHKSDGAKQMPFEGKMGNFPIKTKPANNSVYLIGTKVLKSRDKQDELP